LLGKVPKKKGTQEGMKNELLNPGEKHKKFPGGGKKKVPGLDTVPGGQSRDKNYF